MSFPPIFAHATGSSVVLNLLGASPTRFYLFGESPDGVTKPYAVWQLVSGSPYNALATLPDTDRYPTQVDVYATTASSARAGAAAPRDAAEPGAYVASWRGEARAAAS